ncbi:hypothetical protein [Streptomyces sp. 6-11-2]|nr:hypothetical protein [Streptomyces sp. 6-11-2]
MADHSTGEGCDGDTGDPRTAALAVCTAPASERLSEPGAHLGRP